jgi:DNA repair exonuclease SbcCD nuclease subunit
MVKKVIHISDIHIKNSIKDTNIDKKVKNLVSSVVSYVKESGLDKREIRIVIAGDIYDQKVKASNEANSVFYWMLNIFNSLCKVIIIAGNHDMLENNMDRMDSISPTFEIKGVYKNVAYLDKKLGYKSGIMTDDNIVWVDFSMFDKYAPQNIKVIREQYPDSKVIGLYHGNIPGAMTDAGYTIDKGIDTKEFKGCDCVMAGHIHKYQVIKRNGVPIVYAGSPFQQDAGENVSGHGYVVWDLETMKHEHIDVENDYKIYKFEITSYDDVENDEEFFLNP